MAKNWLRNAITIFKQFSNKLLTNNRNFGTNFFSKTKKSHLETKHRFIGL